ncbi:MAG TPA: PmoA family protein [Humisphaera sp.]
MRRTLSRSLIALAAVLAAPAVLAPVPARAADAAAQAAAPAVKLSQQADKIVVEVGGKPFTEYLFAVDPANTKGPVAAKPWARPFFYPVLAADGTNVVSDQVMTNAKEHPHHRGIWVAQGDVNGVDHWAHAKAGPQPQQRHVKFDKVEGDTIVEQLTWDGKDGKPQLAETRTWRFVAYPDGSRGIDQTSVFTAVAGPVTFGETKEAGIAAVRVAKPISDTSVITMAGGVVSQSVKTEKTVWGKKADWCDLSGKIEGKDYGAAIFDHPSNPRHPGNWHVRHYGLMGANIFGLSEFDKANPKGSGAFTIEPGKPVTFKYQIVIHPGDATAAKLAEKYAAWSK